MSCIEPPGEVFLPAFGQGGSVQSFLQQVAIVSLTHQEPVHFGDRDSLLFTAQDLKRISRRDLSFLFNRKIEAAAAADQKALDHLVALKSRRQFVARHPRLANDQDGRSDLQTVADVEIVFAEARGREIFPKHSPRKLHVRELVPPKWVVLRRIRVHGLVRASVNGKVGLAVAVEVQPA